MTLGFSSIDDVFSAQILENFGKGYESNKEWKSFVGIRYKEKFTYFF